MILICCKLIGEICGSAKYCDKPLNKGNPSFNICTYFPLNDCSLILNAPLAAEVR
jgi:hypothetical protein